MNTNEREREPLGPTRVTIHYFKPSGKWYCDDEGVEWPRDPDHYSGWVPFDRIARLKDMFAVCMENPLGFPQFARPTRDWHTQEPIASKSAQIEELEAKLLAARHETQRAMRLLLILASELSSLSSYSRQEEAFLVEAENRPR